MFIIEPLTSPSSLLPSLFHPPQNSSLELLPSHISNSFTRSLHLLSSHHGSLSIHPPPTSDVGTAEFHLERRPETSHPSHPYDVHRANCILFTPLVLPKPPVPPAQSVDFILNRS